MKISDSTFSANANGIRIGDPQSTSTIYLVRAERAYNTPSSRYGYFTRLENSNTGVLRGHYNEINSDGNGFLFGFQTIVGSTIRGSGTSIGGDFIARNNTSSTSNRYGVRGFAEGSSNTGGTSYGVYGSGSAGTGSTAFGVYGTVSGSATKYAGWFQGNALVTGTLSKGAGAFKIDHPLDPANKYLQHSFVESPDMMNVYNGNVITNANGDATITLPVYFESLNRDFRYQLTVVGVFAQAIVAEKVSGNQFSIKTDKPNVEVSWQVTGIRQDPYAIAHRIEVEVDKPAKEKGLYMHPVEHGLSETMQLHYEQNIKAQEPPPDVSGQ